MRNVIVTGASRGIGLAIAQHLCASGYRVIAVSRNADERLDLAIEEADARSKGSLQFAPFDLAEVDAIPDFVASLRKENGPIYGLINNAGISSDGTLSLMPTAKIEQMIRINTLSPILLTRSLIGSMMARGEGRVINIASIVAVTGYSGLAVYSATKAALVGFTRSLAREVGITGITVNAIAPGFIDTDMTGSVSEERRKQIARRAALRRLVSVHDVAHTAEFLMSDQARNMTGTVLTIDAGNTA